MNEPQRLKISARAPRLAVTAMAGALAMAASSAQAQLSRNVLIVGNAQSGSLSFIDEGSLTNLGSINAIPDLSQRLAEMSVLRRTVYEVTKAQKGGDRFVDDVAVSKDGRIAYVSRSSLVDVVAIDLVAPDHPILWRTPLAGVNADHMGISPDGKTIAVSASSDGNVWIIETATGKVATKVNAGSFPHQNDYSADGKYIYNSSIGNVLLPYALNFLKGTKAMTIIDAATYKVVKAWSLPYGIRPNVLTRDGGTLYTQLSYFNGLAKVDMNTGKILQQVEMPFSDYAKEHFPSKDDYPQNSAHHGLALSGDETKACIAGTIDNYIAVVSLPAMTTDRIMPSGGKPYWATTSSDGSLCYVSNSESGDISVVNYRTAQEVVRLKVGAFPQRSRLAKVPQQVIGALSSSGG